MDIRQLHYFLVLCEEMNYTRAAQRLFLSRQALRQSITASLYCAASRLSCAPRKKTQVRIPQHTTKMPTNSTMGPAMARRPVVLSLCLIPNSSPTPGKACLSVRPDFQQRSPGRQGKGGQFAQSLTVR